MLIHTYHQGLMRMIVHMQVCILIPTSDAEEPQATDRNPIACIVHLAKMYGAPCPLYPTGTPDFRLLVAELCVMAFAVTPCAGRQINIPKT